MKYLIAIALALALVGCETDPTPSNEPAAPAEKTYTIRVFGAGGQLAYWYCATMPEEVRPGVWVFTNKNSTPHKTVTVVNPTTLTIE